MALRPIFQLLLIFVALASVDSTEFQSQSFFKNFYVSQPFNGYIHIISKKVRKINKNAARATCNKLGGYQATLGAWRKDYEHFRKTIIQSGLRGPVFAIGEASKHTPGLMHYPLKEKGNCTFFIDITGLYNFNVMAFAPCVYTGHVVCEVKLLKAEPTGSSSDPKFMLQRFTVLPSYKGSIYIVSRYKHYFNLAQANSVCKEYGGYLWQFETKDEFDFVRKRIDRADYYTGLNDVSSEGEYRWFHSGRSISSTYGTSIPWRTHQPDNWNNEDCVVLGSDRLLNDLNCANHQLKHICEVPIDANT